MISRRTFAIVVRVLAVLAAIYTFFTFRSQIEEQRPPRGGAIPAKVISRETACGWLMVTESPADSAEQIRLDQNRSLLEAIQNPGQRIAVKNAEECGRLVKLSGSIVSTDKGPLKIDFRKAL